MDVARTHGELAPVVEMRKMFRDRWQNFGFCEKDGVGLEPAREVQHHGQPDILCGDEARTRDNDIELRRQRKIDRRNAEITAQYEALLGELVKTVRRKNEIINNYRSALKELTDREREYGYIIDARNKTKMRVYLNPSLRAKPGLRANIFRKDDEYIADIEIFFDNEGPCAKVLNIADGKTIGAFDKIYLEDR